MSGNEADLVNDSKDGYLSRNTWKCDDGDYHYCPFCDTLEKCKERDCDFSTINGTHLFCAFHNLLNDDVCHVGASS